MVCKINWMFKTWVHSSLSFKWNLSQLIGGKQTRHAILQFRRGGLLNENRTSGGGHDEKTKIMLSGNNLSHWIAWIPNLVWNVNFYVKTNIPCIRAGKTKLIRILWFITHKLLLPLKFHLTALGVDGIFPSVVVLRKLAMPAAGGVPCVGSIFYTTNERLMQKNRLPIYPKKSNLLYWQIREYQVYFRLSVSWFETDRCWNSSVGRALHS